MRHEQHCFCHQVPPAPTVWVGAPVECVIVRMSEAVRALFSHTRGLAEGLQALAFSCTDADDIAREVMLSE